VSLAPPETVRKLQETLHAKAKGAPGYRFYLLYDKVDRRDVLGFAYDRCRSHGGAPGIDGQTCADIEAYGVEKWLDELAEDLRRKTYPPQPVRRVYIPKPDGNQRPLGIGTIRDRVAQMATVLVLEPIFEADLEPEQHAYRAEHSVLEGAIAPMPRITRLFWAFSSPILPESASRGVPAIVSTTDTPAPRRRSNGSPEGPRSADLPPHSMPSPIASDVA